MDNYIARSIDAYSEVWKNRERRKPLVVRGARQVGKSQSIKTFGDRAFENIVVVDFEQNRQLQRIFSDNLQVNSILLELEAELSQKIRPGETLLFFDEIQACPRALTALRYFYEQKPELHVIVAGSLLEFAFEDISFPVGRVEFAWLRPLDFNEFLLAAGEKILTEHRPTLGSKTRIPDIIHDKLNRFLRLYFIVGGMPEAVSTFIETDSLTEVIPVHNALGISYSQDFIKYSLRVDRECIDHIFQQLPSHNGKLIKYTALHPEKRIEKIKSCLKILEQSLIIHKVKSTTAQGLPLSANGSTKIFKYIFVDIGLVHNLCGIAPREILAEKNLLNLWNGMAAEQFIGQEMLAQRAISDQVQLFQWTRTARNSSAEVDYVFVNDKYGIVPAEVKSGPAGRLKSLHMYMAEHTECTTGFVFSSANVSYLPEQRLVFLPLYSKFE